MDAKDIHDMDESLMDIINHFVPTLKSFFDGLVKEGFTETQALELTKTFMVLGKPK